MKPAIFTSFDGSIPFAQAISMICEAGFEAVALGGGREHSGYLTATQRTETRRLIAESGMTIDSLHAPFPEGDRLFSLDEPERVESVRQCQNALDAAVDLDGRIVVVHLIQPYGIPPGEVRSKMIDQGRRSMSALAARAVDRDVKLAMENGQRRAYDQVLVDLLTEFDDPHIGFCYDTGHENVQGTCFSLLEEFGDRLFTIHVHDNTGTDSHMLPFEGTIDWTRFREVLHGLPYSGNLLLEASPKNSQWKAPREFLMQAKRCADSLLEEVR